MKSKGSSGLVKSVMFVLLVASLSPSLAKAQAAAEGKFSLPFATRWGTAILPPGDYSFSIKSAYPPSVIVVRPQSRQGAAAMILAQAYSTEGSSGTSALTVTRNEGKPFVSALYLRELGLTLHYFVPPTHRAKGEESARGPDRMPPASASGPAK